MEITAFGIIISFILGPVFGSFTSMASYRIPRNESIFKGRSRCPNCKHNLGIKDLFPVFSWLFSKGKCRHCHAKISASYLFHELTLGSLFLLVFLIYGLSWLTLIIWGVAICLVILIAIDLEHYYLPDTVQIPLAILALAYSLTATSNFTISLLGGLAYFALGYGLRLLGYALKKMEAFGWGDIKFFGIVGIFLGLNPLKAAIFFFCAGVIGIITALIWKKLDKGEVFPFGPSLALSLMGTLLFASNEYLIRSYLTELL